MQEQLKISDKILDFSREQYGEKSSQFTDGLYLRAKLVYTMGQAKESLDLVRQCIKIELGHPRSGGRKDLNLGMMHLLKASILCKLTKEGLRVKEGLKSYRKAA